MATDINRVELSGNMTRDPELRTTASGMTVMSFGIACNDSRKNNQTGEWENVANFIDCTMFGKRAESVSNYLSKGLKIFIAGKLRYSTWEHDGQKRSKIEVIVDDLVFTGNQSNNQQQGYQQPQQYAPQPQYQSPQQYAPQPMQPVAAPQQCAPQPQQYQQPPRAQIPVVDKTASVYDEDIPF